MTSIMQHADSYNMESIVAVHAVHRASLLTKDVMKSIDSFNKDDASPVTIADFAAQALIIHAIKHYFPDDDFIAEESADLLRASHGAADRAWQLIQDVASIEQQHSSFDALPGDFPIPPSKEEMLDCIDLGSSKHGPRPGRIWILDPIDGTATFMKSQQYAVCLCLTVDGVQKVAALGCPNLITFANTVEEDLTDKNHYGVVLSAVQGAGCSYRHMRKHQLSDAVTINRPRELGINNFRFVDSANSSHADHEAHKEIYARLDSRREPLELWSMQMKYVALALGAADAMIRIPHSLEYRSYVWDHAGGQLIYQESGGKITDVHGQPFGYGTFRKFPQNCGYVVADPAAHDKILDVVQEALRERGVDGDAGTK